MSNTPISNTHVSNTRGWRHIGVVTVRSVTGRSSNFSSLGEAVRRFGYLIDRGHDGGLVFTEDETALEIPAWRVHQEWANLPRTESGCLRGGCFAGRRRGPVPGTGCSGFRRRSFRNGRTTNERRAREALEHDENARACGIRVRGRRSRLPSVWDDFAIARRGDSWKYYRRTQYRLVG